MRTWQERFFAKVEKTDGGCWLWTANKIQGYGYFGFMGKVRLAHRVLFEHINGPVPKPMELDHLCRNRSCVNPSHLEVVTHAENVRRGDLGLARRQWTHCSHGHEFTDDNTYLRANGTRQCKTCRIFWKREYRTRKAANEPR